MSSCCVWLILSGIVINTLGKRELIAVFIYLFIYLTLVLSVVFCLLFLLVSLVDKTMLADMCIDDTW